MGKKSGLGSMFNQTANLAGLSKHLLATDLDEDLEEDTSVLNHGNQPL
jgi:hypothetical protein